jgi:hypothetical protein
MPRCSALSGIAQQPFEVFGGEVAEDAVVLGEDGVATARLAACISRIFSSIESRQISR